MSSRCRICGLVTFRTISPPSSRQCDTASSSVAAGIEGQTGIPYAASSSRLAGGVMAIVVDGPVTSPVAGTAASAASTIECARRVSTCGRSDDGSPSPGCARHRRYSTAFASAPTAASGDS